MRVLLIEDDVTIARLLKEGLEDEAYAVDVAHDGSEGYRTATADEYDVIILDIMLPGMNGYEVCRALRNDGNKTPILMLTARDAERDIVEGLDTGADDYLAKPFSFDVLLARIRALLRRPNEKLEEVLQVGDLKLDPSSKKVTRASQEINLTAKEYGVLEYLMRNKGKVLSKEQIISHVWDFDADVLPNNVELFVMFLRRKIDKPFKSKLIHTVSGFGYKLEEKS
ncbi:response regulator transcription factor [Candidatus Nanosynbacter sp. TM7-087]|uniref:response regulator transcription factor n=1 Tax=Candidatus Nanosynbacter sp. TM7-087 TaxID=2902631 RepID=UPI001FB7B978|nr:response regulator transcription factor [Candidatus Nanosynbacter sp. TM7-087]MCJ1966631.1 response regulator transcription factor [Candidatus Nanosynbacter sp. TM7-087]